MAGISHNLAQIRWLPVAIFLVTYLLIAVERSRGSHLDRTAAAFCGAVAMVLAHVISLSDSYQATDWNTLIFLLGMMILVAHFQISGCFDWIAVHVARTRFALLVLLVFASGILAAFFVNDTVCLIFTPIVLVVTERLDVPPIPYIIAVATSANVGSIMSVTGNPRNAVIGVSAHFSFLGFLAHLAPESLIGLGLNVFILAFFSAGRSCITAWKDSCRRSSSTSTVSFSSNVRSLPCSSFFCGFWATRFRSSRFRWAPSSS